MHEFGFDDGTQSFKSEVLKLPAHTVNGQSIRLVRFITVLNADLGAS